MWLRAMAYKSYKYLKIIIYDSRGVGTDWKIA